MYVRLNSLEILKLLKTIPQWELRDVNRVPMLTRKYEFKTFEETWSFLTRVSMRAHKLGHHPKIINLYNVVELQLNTHDVGGLSETDFKMAKAFEKAATQLNLKA